MIHNKNPKFIFLHVGKCAGTSIKKSLESIYDCQFSKGHLSLNDLYAKIPKSYSPSNYFKFSVTRNPWDRHVSLYHHMKTVTKRHPNNPEKKKIEFNGSFEEFVDASSAQAPPYEEMDFIIRYENLYSDFNEVLNKLNAPRVNLPHIDYDTDRPKIDYQSYYNNRTKEKVAKFYSKDIKLFNYKFS